VAIQQICIALDNGFLEKIRSEVWIILVAQSLLAVCFYILLTTIGIYKNHPAKFLQAKK
jgi:hypothetical protein